jgi:membrane-bound serine protease (ClpP class)
LKGEQRVLETSNATVEVVSLAFIEQLLAVLTNPNIVFLLLTIGVQAVLIELSSPGGWIAGVIGVVCLALAVYGLGILPVNWFGLVFLAIAFILFILDIKAPTHGALTAAGIVALIVGALVLFNSPSVPAFQRVSVPLVIGTSIITGLIFLGIVGFALRAQRTPVRTGQESLIQRTGIVRTRLDPVGTVQLGSELWTASLEPGQASLTAGERVRVVRVDGVRLVVRKEE